MDRGKQAKVTWTMAWPAAISATALDAEKETEGGAITAMVLACRARSGCLASSARGKQRSKDLLPLDGWHCGVRDTDVRCMRACLALEKGKGRQTDKTG